MNLYEFLSFDGSNFSNYCTIVAMFGLGWNPARLHLRFSIFFFTRLWDLQLLFMYCSMNSSRKVWLFSLFFSQSMHIVYCSRTHKFHFSATFSLKMGPTVLFTHLKIILLQRFLVFNFSFQFSALAKRTLYQFLVIIVLL